jgi:hypothetical protein
VMIGQIIPSGTGMFELIAKFEEEEKKWMFKKWYKKH